ncbi:DUF3560 domain-containing protein [Rhodococcus sp. B50]|uniref:DUF3560 domain-containing protein n=1 Tax=Rhodococcus sp. B50 TaxID=2682847 RepID=UPI001BD3804C|nr:DUF3560 domain-containing protein [Rhodococcus sp. B50]MBS9371082.1 hypothetical protein [Rhodococcus sp. B50]
MGTQHHRAWYIPHSRDRAPHLARIEHTAAALRAAGYDVETDIDTTLRDGTDAHQDRNERLTDRAAALAAKAERKATAAAAAHARHDHACAALPEGGEPIKVGHHSERRHRRALDRAHTTARASIEADAAARSAAESARIAARSTDYRYTPAVIHRRIERQSAELRSIERHLTKYRAAGHTAETSNHMHQLELTKPNSSATSNTGPQYAPNRTPPTAPSSTAAPTYAPDASSTAPAPGTR